MAIEIERKFLLKDKSFKEIAESKVLYRQGYIEGSSLATVRVRIAGEKALLTIKGNTLGLSRSEYEYEIPLAEAKQMQDTLCGQLVEKYRYVVWYEGKCWEVDEFLGDNEGLFIAELELSDESESFAAPAWLGEEVSNDVRYRNSYLATKPFKKWTNWE